MKYYQVSGSNKTETGRDGIFSNVEPSDNTFNIEFKKEFFGELRGAEIVPGTKLLVFYFKKFNADKSTY